MPPFVYQGPDIPLEVLNAYQEERLILFCGAGVSKNLAGLPLFKDLVKDIYAKLNEVMEPPEKAAFKKLEFDRALDLLARRRGDSQKIRQTVADILSPHSLKRGQLRLHKSLLEVAKTQMGYRLVTTNFDNLFEKAAGRTSALRVETAPRLSIPKKHTWASLVHLHGSIENLEGLVLTSGDFGNAYIVERWASRFISDLFREFIVLFVGYSANDVILRYFLDAISAERTKGSGHQEPFALTDIPRGATESTICQQWKEKGVIPIPYVDHSYLPGTFDVWAKDIASGLQSKISLALRDSDRPPQHPDEFAARRTTWLLSQPGVAAAWARRRPAPHIGWLRILDRSNALGSKRLLAWPDPVPETAELIQVRHWAEQPPRLSQTTLNLADWLCHHLGSDELIDWVLLRGGILHPDFRSLIREELQASAKDPRRNSSLTSFQRKLWRVLAGDTFAIHLSRRVRGSDFHLETSVPGELLELLQPAPRLISRSREEKEIHEHLPQLEQSEEEARRPRDRVRVELMLVGGSLATEVAAVLRTDPTLLARSAHGLTSALGRALQWLEFLEEPDEDPTSFWNLDSPEWDEFHGSFEWLGLGGLVRDSYFALKPQGRKALVARWVTEMHPLFDRLVLYVLGKDGDSNPLPAAEILLAEDRNTLWTYKTREEVLSFLEKGAPRLSSRSILKTLYNRILAGPQEEHYQEKDPETTKRRHRVIGERLARLQAGGVALPANALRLLSKIEMGHGWSIAEILKEEPFFEYPSIAGAHQQEADFLRLMDSSLPDLLGRLRIENIPVGWRRFVEKRPVRSLHVLRRLAKERIWRPELWHTTLNAFPSPNETRRKVRLWIVINFLLRNVPEDLLRKEIGEFAHWLLTSTENLPAEREDGFWICWDRHWAALSNREPGSEEAGEEPPQPSLSKALYSPEGDLILTLLNRMWVRRLEKGQGLPETLRVRFSESMRQSARSAHVAQMILAVYLRALYYFDPAWTQNNLLPLFDWQASKQAGAVWVGYLHNSRIDIELLAILKPFLFQALGHRDTLEQQSHVKKHLLRLIGFSGIGLPQVFTKADSRRALRLLAPEELSDVVSAIETMFRDAADEDKERLWRNRIQPWIERAWPKDKAMQSPKLTEAWVEALTQMGGAYPLAVTTLSVDMNLLAPIDPSATLSYMEESELLRLFPAETLLLLDAIFPEQPQWWTAHSLRRALLEVVSKQPDLKQTTRFKRINDLLLSLGIPTS